MRKIEAILDPDQLDAIKGALGLIGVQGMTVCEVRGSHSESFATTRYSGADYRQLQPKIRVEIVVEDRFADAVVRRVVLTANRGRLSDGTIAVLPLADAIRIRTGEHGPDAI
ncbi:MAG TPA: P-II family nitrogen regulator [Myxococcota bacterium]|nr:P-II family nitrogen regulator [Myxococcota bacterium]